MLEQIIVVPVGGESTLGILRMPPGGGPHPLVIHGPGWMSTKDAEHYVRYHAEFAAHGIASLVIDYRTVTSDSKVVDPSSMVEDLMAAVDLASSSPWADPERIVVMGTGGVGAGAAIVAAARQPAARAAVAVSPIATGESWLSFMRTPAQMRDLLEVLEDDKRRRERGEPGGTIAPIGGISIPPEERARIGFKASIRKSLPRMVALETVDRILDFRPIEWVPEIAPRELTLIACRNDVAVPFADAISLRDRARGPCKLVILEETNSYRMHERNWRQIAGEVVDLVRSLAPGAPPTQQGVEVK